MVVTKVMTPRQYRHLTTTKIATHGNLATMLAKDMIPQNPTCLCLVVTLHTCMWTMVQMHVAKMNQKTALHTKQSTTFSTTKTTTLQMKAIDVTTQLRCIPKLLPTVFTNMTTTNTTTTPFPTNRNFYIL